MIDVPPHRGANGQDRASDSSRSNTNGDSVHGINLTSIPLRAFPSKTLILHTAGDQAHIDS